MSGTFESSIIPSGSGGGGGGGTVTSVTAVSPLKSTGGTTPALSGPFTSFVFQPGGTATAPGGNVYTSWSALWTDCSKAAGFRVIYFDNSITDPIVIPAGSYTGMAGVAFKAYSQTALGAVDINLANGVTFDDMPFLEGVSVESLSSSAVISVNGAAKNWVFDNNASITSDVSPFVVLDGGSQVILYLKTASAVLSGASVAFRCLNSSGLIIYLEEEANLDDSITDDGSGTVLVFIASASASTTTTFTGFTGAVTNNLGELASLVSIAVGNATTGTTQTDVSTAVLCGATSYTNPTVTTGDVYVLPDASVSGSSCALLHSTGTLSALTVKTPVNALDGQIASFSFDHAVTTLTVATGNGGHTIVATQPVTATSATVIRLRFCAATSNWWNA